MKAPRKRLCVLVFLIGFGNAPLTSTAHDAQRGRQLFDTHCIACHSKGMFTRDKPIVHNPSQLTEQVRRWQRVAGQEWSAAEVSDVVSYLNERFYKFPDSKE